MNTNVSNNRDLAHFGELDGHAGNVVIDVIVFALVAMFVTPMLLSLVH